MSKKYPKTIYVQFQGEGNNEYLEAHRDFEDAPDDGKVAVYILKEIKNRKTDISLS